MDDRSVFLAFDYGTRNIGVAVGQMVTKSATVLAPIIAHRGIVPWYAIDLLIRHWRPQALIIGVPHKMCGKDLKITVLAQQFGEQLRSRYSLMVYEVEEALTTKAAREELFSRGGYKALQNKSIDSVAARIILEAWLNGDIQN